MLNVTLVDDNPEALRLLSMLLERHQPIEINSFTCPVTALAWVKNCKPDLLVTDYEMPLVTGEGVLNTARSFWPGLPVVVLTGNSEVFHSGRLSHAGARMTLLKGDMTSLRQLMDLVRDLGTNSGHHINAGTHAPPPVGWSR